MDDNASTSHFETDIQVDEVIECASINKTTSVLVLGENECENESSYWRYFVQPIDSQQDKIQCRLCKNVTITRGKDQSTSALVRHLKKSHIKLHDKFVSIRKEKKQKSQSKSDRMKPLRLTKQKQLTISECKVIYSITYYYNKLNLEDQRNVTKR